VRRGLSLPTTIEIDLDGHRSQIWHLTHVELNPPDLDKVFK
jgi:hypothetical protein